MVVPCFRARQTADSGFGHSGPILATQRPTDEIGKRVNLGIGDRFFGLECRFLFPVGCASGSRVNCVLAPCGA
jgi:hypothetical protein